MTEKGNSKRRGIRPVLLVLLWMWALVMFLVVDLFFNVDEFDHVRPDAPLYRGMRKVAHDLVGERFEDEDLAGGSVAVAAAPEARQPAIPNPYIDRKSVPSGTRPPRAVRTHKRTRFRNHGTWTQWNLPGMKPGAGQHNDKGRKEGTWTWAYDDGTKREERPYSDGVLNGAVKAWFPGGQQQTEEHYARGKRTGTWRYWHGNGQLAAQQQYKDGLPDGEWAMWHSDGQRSMKGAYRKGSPSGTWSFWDEHGAIIKEDIHN